jgi:manganese oxidase
MNSDRRNFFKRLGSIGASLAVSQKALANQEGPAAQHGLHSKANHETSPPPSSGRPRESILAESPLPVEAPDLPKLPWKMVEGAKEFHLVAEPVRVEFVPGRWVDVWGYNGSMPGPTLEANEGDRIRVIFENHLPEMTSIHWHGLEVPMDMDGVPGLGQDPVMPGGRFIYEFTLNQHGTFFYHSHFAMQEMMGMVGLFILHPKESYQPIVDRDFGLILQEWAILPNNSVPNTMAMEFNWLTINGKSGPATTPMLVKRGERIRIRFVNLGMDHHPMHLHGNQFVVTGTEGGRIPESAWYPGNTVLVGVAQARDVEFEATYEGDWMVHCHLPHHMMNQMVSMVGPISHSGHAMHAGMSMENGMGMVRGGGALSEEFGPSLGRDIGESARRERATNHLVGFPGRSQSASGDHALSQHQGHAEGAEGDVMYPLDDPIKRQVPGYPQDMWMDMAEWVPEKPEFHGLRPTWERAMMGMMTLVRVLPADLYDKIMALKGQANQEQKPVQSKPVHHHPRQP